MIQKAEQTDEKYIVLHKIQLNDLQEAVFSVCWFCWFEF